MQDDKNILYVTCCTPIFNKLLVTPDAKTYAYSASQQLSELQLVDGIK